LEPTAERNEVTRDALWPASVERGAPPSAHTDHAAAALLYLLDYHSPPVTPHMERTAALARCVGLRLGVGGHTLRAVVRTALLHDIGKVCIPTAVLESNGPLTETEWAMMREHPVLGEALLERTPGLLPIAMLVRSTHERWDGAGYPDGLAGDGIPLPARIVGPCDAFDAMTSYRPYSFSLSREEAVDEICRGAGTQFDPEVAAALCDVVGSGIDATGEAV
jgi:HD-GYP domain-containing protein (c-di-GMP phosphodiesterase class II)